MPLFKPDKKQITRNAGKWDVVLSENMCKACGFCLNICPVDVFAWRDTPNQLGWFPMLVAHEENCIGCMLCFQICPDFCLDVAPKCCAPQLVTEGAVAGFSTRNEACVVSKPGH
jgi:2-oxoglutarate ferredoxin oxidoreductase subunit delta